MTEKTKVYVGMDVHKNSVVIAVREGERDPLLVKEGVPKTVGDCGGSGVIHATARPPIPSAEECRTRRRGLPVGVFAT